jgi:hypothetical protein
VSVTLYSRSYTIIDDIFRILKGARHHVKCDMTQGRLFLSAAPVTELHSKRAWRVETLESGTGFPGRSIPDWGRLAHVEFDREDFTLRLVRMARSVNTSQVRLQFYNKHQTKTLMECEVYKLEDPEHISS